MGLLSKLKVEEGAVEDGDRLGGIQTFASDVYDGTIKVAYLGKSATAGSEAVSVTIVADFGGKEYRETVYVTNSKGETSFVDKNDAKVKRVMGGYTTVNQLCMFTNGQPLDAQEEEPKVVKIYDFDLKKDVNREVSTIACLTGAPIKVAILRQIEVARKPNAQGVYEDTDKTRTINLIDKVFFPEDGRTMSECENEAESAEFLNAWLERNKGKDRDKTNRKAAGAGTGAPGAAGAGAPGAGSGSPSFAARFGKK
jgi:hypothetical protein